MVDKEKRVICGKARTCKISGGKILEVYDEDKKVFLPLDLFTKQQEEYKTNPIVDDTLDKKDEKKEYYTTHGKKTKGMREEKKVEDQTTTSNINLSTSGTSGVDIHVPDTPEIQVNVETKKDNEIENESDPYNWYLKRILRRT